MAKSDRVDTLLGSEMKFDINFSLIHHDDIIKPKVKSEILKVSLIAH